MTSNRRVTMVDVAAHVGLSRTTVSFVLSGRPNSNIPDDTRDRVWAAVRELGYRPNAAATSLASQRTHLIGLVTEIAATPFAGEIIRGAQRRAWDSGKLLLVASTDGEADVEKAAVETMLARQVEGILYATGWHRAVTLPAAAHEVPTVLINCFDADGAYPAIIPDEVDGGYVATRRLTDAGHRRIGFINLDPDIPAAVGRRAGYERALREVGVEPDPRLVVVGHATADGGYDRAGELLELDEPPTAIFCGTDRMAMGAYDAIKDRGLKIPQDIAVVGFDNQEIIAGYLRPKLTTVALPFEEMGALAVSTLTDDTTAEHAGVPRLVSCPLVERASV